MTCTFLYHMTVLNTPDKIKSVTIGNGYGVMGVFCGYLNSPKQAKDSTFSSVLVVYLFYSEIFSAPLSNLKVDVMGQRSDEAFSLLYP